MRKNGKSLGLRRRIAKPNTLQADAIPFAEVMQESSMFFSTIVIQKIRLLTSLCNYLIDFCCILIVVDGFVHVRT